VVLGKKERKERGTGDGPGVSTRGTEEKVDKKRERKKEKMLGEKG